MIVDTINTVFMLSLVISTSIMAKIYDTNGKKSKSLHPFKGTIHRIEIASLIQLKELLVFLYSQPYHFIIQGISVYKNINFVRGDDYKKAVELNPWTITKSDKHLMYPLNGVIFIDYDFNITFPHFTYQELVDVLHKLIPELITCGMLVKYSSSAHIKNVITGEYLSDAVSMHLFILATEVTEENILKFKKLLNNAMESLRYKKEVEGKVVSVIDDTSFSKQKPFLTSAPIIQFPYRKDFYEFQIFEGTSLDMSTIDYDRYGEVKVNENLHNSFSDIFFGSSRFNSTLGISISEATVENLAHVQSIKVRKAILYASIKPYINNEITYLLLKFLGYEVKGLNNKFRIREDDRTPSTGILANGMIIDLGPNGFKGDIFKFIKEEFNVSFKESLFFIADCLGVQYE